MLLPCSLSLPLRLLLRSTSAALAATDTNGSTDAPGAPSSTAEDEVIFYAGRESDDLRNLKIGGTPNHLLRVFKSII